MYKKSTVFTADFLYLDLLHQKGLIGVCDIIGQIIQYKNCVDCIIFDIVLNAGMIVTKVKQMYFRETF